MKPFRELSREKQKSTNSAISKYYAVTKTSKRVRVNEMRGLLRSFFSGKVDEEYPEALVYFGKRGAHYMSNDFGGKLVLFFNNKEEDGLAGGLNALATTLGKGFHQVRTISKMTQPKTAKVFKSFLRTNGIKIFWESSQYTQDPYDPDEDALYDVGCRPPYAIILNNWGCNELLRVLGNSFSSSNSRGSRHRNGYLDDNTSSDSSSEEESSSSDDVFDSNDFRDNLYAGGNLPSAPEMRTSSSSSNKRGQSKGGSYGRDSARFYRDNTSVKPVQMMRYLFNFLLGQPVNTPFPSNYNPSLGGELQIKGVVTKGNIGFLPKVDHLLIRHAPILPKEVKKYNNNPTVIEFIKRMFVVGLMTGPLLTPSNDPGCFEIRLQKVDMPLFMATCNSYLEQFDDCHTYEQVTKKYKELSGQSNKSDVSAPKDEEDEEEDGYYPDGSGY